MTCQLPSDIASMQVATADKTLVTLTAVGRSCSLPTSGNIPRKVTNAPNLMRQK
jgi:hypothetical protein